ncbi:conserved exported hypothetical protein [Thiomonas arsenitoxydans]|uniref:DUF4390 domain-containing protein n=2 Tax=Thiomonas TaxID=32012 RepID=D6CNC5_THIA3|nr:MULTISPECIES: DUF4390 domain-containing protein [Thiomonas]MBN8745681.1 DUF4390 domain-containing protein [Thiomonas arsenitoxydans]ODU94005.1 MAG: hypothetical protein ABT24_13035 [Thiomonas sp. SCN 64-16]CAZ90053.1 conserved hypothetical protein; putative exported protein [Thiomonas arsenitoxydans]CQR37168.1 conserved exported hypothetical protein [Thiomonas arsenitoxydans]CQR38272.1 conserved exported hypothetical protein [Thiomonas arsenitoxydans]
MKTRPASPDPMRRKLLRNGLALAAGVSLISRARATTVDTEPLMLTMSPEGLFVTTAAVFALPRSLEDVLHRGIALYFETVVTVVRPRWYWFNEDIAQARREVRLAYQPLLQRYRVSVGGLQQNYDSLDEALGVVQRTRHLRVAEPSQLTAGQTYQLDARFKLDLSQLPRPFQLNVSSQSDWKIEATFPPQPFVWTP